MNFGKKVHSLNTAQMYSMKILLTRMNNETIVKDNGRTFSTTIIKELSGKKNRFIDTRMIFEKVADNKQMTGKTLFIMDKTQLVIDNSTGNIIMAILKLTHKRNKQSPSYRIAAVCTNRVKLSGSAANANPMYRTA